MLDVIDKMRFTVGDLEKSTASTTVIMNYGGISVMEHNSYNNSVNMGDGNTLVGNQVAPGSDNFSGKIESVSVGQKTELEELTEKLIDALKNEKDIEKSSTEDIIDAVNQAEKETKKKKINKVSLMGIISGINLVMNNIQGISTATYEIYTKWQDVITSL